MVTSSIDSSKPVVFFRPHLGLGDHIICNGLVRYLSESHTVHCPAKQHNVDSVRWMFRDIDVVVHPVKDDNHADRVMLSFAKRRVKVVNVHFGSRFAPNMRRFANENFCDRFYLLAGLDPAVRYSHFKLVRDHVMESEVLQKVAPEGNGYVVVHDDVKRGAGIDDQLLPSDLPIVRVRPGVSSVLFGWLKVIKLARQYHGIDSSVTATVDHLDLMPNRRYYHVYARNVGRERLYNQKLREGWSIVQRRS